MRDGEQVAVKIKRPGIARQMKEQESMLLRLATPFPHMQRVLRDSFYSVGRELDFHAEAANMAKFATQSYVQVPEVRLVTDECIVMSYLPGERLGPKHKRHTSTMVDFFTYQIICMGLIYTDTHSGNMAVTEDGGLCFYDFAGCVPLAGIGGMLIAVVTRDGEALYGALVAAGYMYEASTPLQRLRTIGALE